MGFKLHEEWTLDTANLATILLRYFFAVFEKYIIPYKGSLQKHSSKYQRKVAKKFFWKLFKNLNFLYIIIVNQLCLN